jgi:hypothetical protein
VVVLVRRRDLLALVIGFMLICPSGPDFLFAQEQKSAQPRVWQVKESPTRLWIADGRLVSTTAQEVPESIPLSAMKALAYVTTSDSPAAEEIGVWVQDMWEAAPSDAGEASGFIIIPLVAGTVIPAIFLPLKQTRHLVYVDWEQEGKEEHRVYLLSKPDALSLLEGLRRGAGLQCSRPGSVRCSNWVAVEKGSAEGSSAAGQHERGRLVEVDRGHGISSLEMVPVPEPVKPQPQETSASCPGSRDFEAMLGEARRWLEETERKEDGKPAPPSPESPEPKLRIPPSQLRTTIILSEISCRQTAAEPATEKK